MQTGIQPSVILFLSRGLVNFRRSGAKVIGSNPKPPNYMQVQDSEPQMGGEKTKTVIFNNKIRKQQGIYRKR